MEREGAMDTCILEGAIESTNRDVYSIERGW